MRACFGEDGRADRLLLDDDEVCVLCLGGLEGMGWTHWTEMRDLSERERT